jgi:hypothetical protein
MPNKSDKQYDLFVPNKTRPIVRRDIPSNVATLEVIGVATGGGALIIQVDSVTTSYTTIAAETAAVAASAAAAQYQSALDAAYAVGEYDVSAVGTTITIVRTNGNPLWLEEQFSTDATQSIESTGGDHHDTALLHEVTTAGTGRPLRYDDGHTINDPDLPAADRSVTLVLEAELTNGSGGAVTARWKVWWWFDSLGWVEDQEVGIRSITQTSGSGLQKDVIAVSAVGAEKCAVELEDDGASGNLPAGASFSVWGVIAH